MNDIDEANADPMDYYSEYCDWLMRNEMVWNSQRLVDLFESGHRFEEFLEERKS